MAMGRNMQDAKQVDKKKKNANSVKISFKRLTAEDLEKKRVTVYNYVL